MLFSLVLKWRPIHQCIISKLAFHKDVGAGDINYVELVGTVHRHLHTKPSGRKTIIVKTIEQTEQLYHIASTSTCDSLVIGQRVQLIGRVSSQNIWTDDNKLKHKVSIKATELYRCPPDIDQDSSRVRLLAIIGSEIQNFSDSSEFTLTTKHKPSRGLSTGIFTTEFHRIIVQNSQLLPYVRENLTKSNRVLVEGVIRYQKYRSADGKGLTSGYIEARSIRKLDELFDALF